MIDGKHILVTGGTGSLGKFLVRRLLGGIEGMPASVTIFSRDEAKQDRFRSELLGSPTATDDVVYRVARDRVRFKIGSVTDRIALAAALRPAQVVFHAAALKQVPSCEYHPIEAVRTNVDGASNIIDIIAAERLPVEVVVGISTDKACEPVSVMGMSKALQERIFVEANLRVGATRFVMARYGNVLASRGSVLPLFHQQIASGGPVTVTSPDMTRFFMSLDQAVDTVIEAVRSARPGEIAIPYIQSVLVADVAAALIGDRAIETEFIGARPGEKVHETLVSADEAARTVTRGTYLYIRPLLPQLAHAADGEPWTGGTYSSASNVLSLDEVREFLAINGMTVEKQPFSATSWELLP